MGESKTSVRRIVAVERQLKALELRKAGTSYPKIAQALGYASPNGAYKAILSALKRTLQEPADSVRKIELERLDSALLSIWERVTSGNDYAIDRMLAIEKRRAALLGLDAPVKIAPTLPDGKALNADRMTDDERLKFIAEFFIAAGMATGNNALGSGAGESHASNGASPEARDAGSGG